MPHGGEGAPMDRGQAARIRSTLLEETSQKCPLTAPLDSGLVDLDLDSDFFREMVYWYTYT